MGKQAELVVPTQVIEPLADRYWLFPFSKTVEARGRPNKLVRLPLAPRPAPRRQLESAGELLGHPIPDWVVALWSCNINLGMLAYQEAGQLGKYIIEVDRADGTPLEAVILGLGRFRRPIKDYFAICDSYFQAIRQSTAQQIETVDMARRAIHNQAAELLIERLDGKIEVDFDTARRLFTLICVLHIKQ